MTTAIFSQQLSAFAGKTDERLNLVVRKILLDISTRLVLRSPVGDAKYWKHPPPAGYVGGRFRGNWQYGQLSPNITTTTTVDKSGAATIRKLSSAIPQFTGTVHFITNSLPYSIPLENGWSWRQAPNGMVALTVVEFDAIVAAAAAELT